MECGIKGLCRQPLWSGSPPILTSTQRRWERGVREGTEWVRTTQALHQHTCTTTFSVYIMLGFITTKWFSRENLEFSKKVNLKLLVLLLYIYYYYYEFYIN